MSLTCLCCGGRYQTSQTRAQLVRMLRRCRESDCWELFQNGSANRGSYCNIEDRQLLRKKARQRYRPQSEIISDHSTTNSLLNSTLTNQPIGWLFAQETSVNIILIMQLASADCCPEAKPVISRGSRPISSRRHHYSKLIAGVQLATNLLR